ncbi:Nif3-like dinuclear metal center hexameric protein [Caloramator sp. ALD01]|uniref:Nif3-like dinuclear metal center hexameric protein n=1 Tax=Caloramator sp. ALD01 TaxID=1031288 RepID=UPI0004004963|nr:Nif3-like dinuclear metal center hexameric protein [Caloramator sp. ALD01]
MSVILKDLINFIEERYPKKYAEEYDNVGLLVGDENNKINKILVTVDITKEVIKEAIENKVNLIISHHPLIFKPIKNLNKKSSFATMIYDLIKNDINVYALHTNYDIANDGMNDVISKKLNLKNVSVLEETNKEKLYKIITYVPTKYAEELKEALFNAGAGCIGKYDKCSFNVLGEGTFRPLNGTNPFIGQINKLQRVEEIKIETIVTASNLNTVINTLVKNHPYEEPAFDIIKLENTLPQGLGRIGYLDIPLSAKDFAMQVKKIFNLKMITLIGDKNKKINKVAVIGGSGSDLINVAKSKGCDLILTGDVKHHIAIDAIENDIVVLDVTHFGLEQVFIEDIYTLLTSNFDNIEVMKTYSKQPFYFI